MPLQSLQCWVEKGQVEEQPVRDEMASAVCTVLAGGPCGQSPPGGPRRRRSAKGRKGMVSAHHAQPLDYGGPGGGSPVQSGASAVAKTVSAEQPNQPNQTAKRAPQLNFNHDIRARPRDIGRWHLRGCRPNFVCHCASHVVPPFGEREWEREGDEMGSRSLHARLEPTRHRYGMPSQAHDQNDDPDQDSRDSRDSREVPGDGWPARAGWRIGRRPGMHQTNW
ncbi:hypothetical protein B0J11DRAFT_529968 [Dendryphion nanum]|uniref:Uncharacterized protein n=1 Tax=Dendryphion nanum TaxID=256645 RepID=A0A9P9DNB4_9PLEO|nr:hypothetical protein B0J11DRAFT_529968 [Dendryphion nanum]